MVDHHLHLGVLVIDLTMNIGIIGVVPWQVAEKSTTIGTDFMPGYGVRQGRGPHHLVIIWTPLPRCTPACSVPLGFRSTRLGELFFKPFG